MIPEKQKYNSTFKECIFPIKSKPLFKTNFQSRFSFWQKHSKITAKIQRHQFNYIFFSAAPTKYSKINISELIEKGDVVSISSRIKKFLRYIQKQRR
jgi:hypothetical protein